MHLTTCARELVLRIKRAGVFNQKAPEFEGLRNYSQVGSCMAIFLIYKEQNVTSRVGRTVHHFLLSFRNNFLELFRENAFFFGHWKIDTFSFLDHALLSIP